MLGGGAGSAGRRPRLPGDVPCCSATPTRMPSPASRQVAAEEELQELYSALERRETELVSELGPLGAGEVLGACGLRLWKRGSLGWAAHGLKALFCERVGRVLSDQTQALGMGCRVFCARSCLEA